MSNVTDRAEPEPTGFPELSPLGKQLEFLRIGRGLSKQHLARGAGTSRQQLWRVMTGKSDLTGPLRQRLADVLRVDASALSGVEYSAPWTSPPTATEMERAPFRVDSSVTLESYLADVSRLERTIALLPSGEDGRELKRALLNALEDRALTRRVTLGPAFFDVRRRVLAGEL